MTKTTGRTSPHRKSKALLALFAATAAMAGGAQALSPAPAAAGQTEKWTDMGIFGTVCTQVDDGQGGGGEHLRRRGLLRRQPHRQHAGNGSAGSTDPTAEETEDQKSERWVQSDEWRMPDWIRDRGNRRDCG